MNKINLQWEEKGSTPPPSRPDPSPELNFKENSNLLLQGDNYSWLAWLQEKGYSFDLIYMDPPFCTGNRFSSNIKTRAGQLKVESLGFRDSWSKGLGNYLEMIRARLVQCQKLLKETGSIFVHLDWRTAHEVKVIMDEILGRDNFRNEIIWWYHDPSGTTRKSYMRKHDNILFYSRTDNYRFNLEEIRVPYAAGTLKQAEQGVLSFGRRTRVNPRGRPPEDVWEIPIINSQARERLGYPTQKPLALLERIIKGSTGEGDLILDPFCGSGTTLEAAEKLGRRWVGIDQNNFGLFLARKRARSRFAFARDKSSLGAKGRDLIEQYYKKNPAPGVRVLVQPDLKELAGLNNEETVHWWDVEFNWEQADRLQNEQDNLLLFPLYDQTGLPLGYLDWGKEQGEEYIRLEFNEYRQPWGQHSELEILDPEEFLQEINVYIDGKKKTVVMPPFPCEISLPLRGNERQVSLQVLDILGRERWSQGELS